MNVQQQTDVVQIVSTAPTVDITVASGVDGKRGSYTFVGTLTDPNSAVDYTEITQDPDVHIYIYDIYYSSSQKMQWQYRSGPSGIKWYTYQAPELFVTTPAQFHRQVIDGSLSSTHNIVHNFGTYDVVVQVYSDTNPRITVGTYVERTSINQVTIKLNDLGTYVVLLMSLPMV